MARTITVVFDGEVFRPREPVDLPANSEYQLTVDESEPLDTGASPGAFDAILALAQHLGVADLAEQHDHYAHGTPKR